jgi:hypothetical protein
VEREDLSTPPGLKRKGEEDETQKINEFGGAHVRGNAMEGFFGTVGVRPDYRRCSDELG